MTSVIVHPIILYDLPQYLKKQFCLELDHDIHVNVAC